MNGESNAGIAVHSRVRAWTCRAHYVGFGEHPPYRVDRFRVSLDVKIDGKIVTGSSVYRVSYSRFGPLRFGEGPPTSADWQGNALTVDLGARGLLFMARFESACRKASERLDDIVAKLSANGGNSWTSDIAPASLPLLMHFRNIDSKDSIEEVDPGDLAAAFGPGIKLLSAHVDSTDAAPSGIPRAWPRWLSDDAPTPYGLLQGSNCKINFNELLFKY